MSDPGVPRSGTLARGRRGAARVLARYQAYLFFPMLLLEALSMLAMSVRAVLNGPVRCRTVVRAFCAQAGLLYCEKGLVSSYSEVLRYLHAAGR